MTICHLDPVHDVDTGPVSEGALVGRYSIAAPGTSSGPHLHLIYRNASTILDPFDLWGGEAAMGREGFTFNATDPTTCEEEGE